MKASTNGSHAPSHPNRQATPPAAATPKESSGASERARYNVMQPVYREGRDKPFWQRLGTAFENPGKNGGPASISVKLDALPMGGDLVLFVAEESTES